MFVNKYTEFSYVKFVKHTTGETLTVCRLPTKRNNQARLADIRTETEDKHRCQVHLQTASQHEWEEWIDKELKQLDQLMGRG